jgi:DNA (cytosine-5)-methyltransferase 1
MAAYYNELEPFAAEWLRNLIAAGHIAPGDVDERSIVEVQPDDVREYDQCHFFAGIGGWSYALRLAGWPDDRPVWTGSCPCQPFSVAGAQRGSEDERHLWPAFFRLIREYRPATVLGEQVAGAAGLAWLDHVLADLEGEGYAAAAADLPACSVGAPHRRQRLWWVANCNGAGFSEPHGQSQEPAQQASRWIDVARRGADGGMGDTERARREGGQQDDLRGARRGSEGGQPVEPGGVFGGALEHADGVRRAWQSLGEGEARIDGPGPWSDIEWIPCRDGRYRPTQPGLFPLVTRLSNGMVRGGDRSVPLNADNSAEGRASRLRGYGNSIVPQVAAEFIEAVMECIP